MEINSEKVKEVRLPTVIRGIGAMRGVAIGPLRFDKAHGRVGKESEAKESLALLDLTLELTEEEIRAMREKAVKSVGEEHGEIFGLFLSLLDRGGSFVSEMRQWSKSGKCPGEAAKLARMALSQGNTADEKATAAHLSRLSEIIALAEDEAKCRLREIGEVQKTPTPTSSKEKYILVSAETAAHVPTAFPDIGDNVIGIVCIGGTENSSLASYGKAKGIPTVVIAEEDSPSERLDGAGAIVDGSKGRLTVNPDLSALDRFSESVREAEETEKRLALQIGMPSVTLSGRHIPLLATAGSLSEAEDAVAADAEGIGLLSTDGLFAQSETLPTEDALHEYVSAAAELLRDKPLTVRIYSGGGRPANGYCGMGQTGVRYCLAKRSFFKNQLKAILRTAARHELSAVIPGAVSAEELRRVKAVMLEAANELRAGGVPFGDMLELGAMIDTPAAAIMCDSIAEEADFCIVDCDRLLSLCLSADRRDPAVSEILGRNREPVLRLLNHVSSVFHSSGRGKKTGVCGDMASDPGLTEKLISSGADFLSVSPPHVLEIREKIRESSI